MPHDPERLKRLNMAASFCLFDKRLRSSGNGSIVWGILNLVLGGLILANGGKWGAVSVLLGLILVAAGGYERKARDPKVIIVSASTLALLAVWNFTLIAMAAMGLMKLALGGKTLYWAIAQAWGAYATWKTYSVYRTLRDETDPLTVEQVRSYIDEVESSKPAQSLDLVEFDANAGFVQGTKRYRLKPLEDLYMTSEYRVQLGRMQLQAVAFVPRSEVILTPEGGKWMSKKIQASIQLGSVTLYKVTIVPDMATRINPSAQMISLTGTR